MALHLDDYHELVEAEVAKLNLECSVLLNDRPGPSSEPKRTQWGIRSFGTEFTLVLLTCFVGILVSYLTPSASTATG
jgi:hypothetical protein